MFYSSAINPSLFCIDLLCNLKDFKITHEFLVFNLRMITCSSIALPLGISMIVVGALSINGCSNLSSAEDAVGNTIEKFPFIPIWLLVAGCVVLLVIPVYYIYDSFSRSNPESTRSQSFANLVIIVFLMCGLVWAIVGFLWVFGATEYEVCGANSNTYKFAFGVLIILNGIMDVWICYKICLILHWAFLSED
jgi:hypothetical protein